MLISQHWVLQYMHPADLRRRRAGRLQFTLGAWAMADEGCTHYSAVIGARALGLRLLRDLFGECSRPLVAWQPDPFGHSREFANLFAQV